MNAVVIISIIGVLALGWWLMRRNAILGLIALGVGIVSAVAAFGLTGFVTSIPPALASGVSAVLSGIGS